jgi:hypothetical protein
VRIHRSRRRNQETDHKLKEAILSKSNCSLKDILEMARVGEVAKMQAHFIAKSEPEYRVKEEPLGSVQAFNDKRKPFKPKPGQTSRSTAAGPGAKLWFIPSRRRVPGERT